MATPAKPSCRRVTPKLLARFILLVAAALYATTLALTIRNHASNPIRPTPIVGNPPTNLLHTITNLHPNSTDESIAHYLAQKWNLTTPHAPALLLRQFSLHIKYNPQSDFLHFHHIPKTGGTTISDLLERIFGPDAVLPGSRRSEPIQFHEFDNTTRTLRFSTNTNGPPHYKVSYGHSRLRPIHGPNRTGFSIRWETYSSSHVRRRRSSSPPTPQRIRSLAMIRDPTNLRASTHAMAMCALNGKVNTFNYWRMKRNETTACTKEEGLDLEKLVQDYHSRVWNKCRLALANHSDGNASTHNKRLDKYERRICTHGPQSMSHCLSPSHLLSSPAYGGMRSMYKSFLGRYFADQIMGDTNSYVSVERVLRRRYGAGGSGGEGRGMERIEEYALVDLGGLDMVQCNPYDMEGFLSKLQAVQSPIDITTTTTTHPIEEDSSYDEPDILWFGITERMIESTCLLFYVLRVPPISVPKSRVVNCSPASWWSAKDREEVKRREEGDYALWRVANAILDVRMEKMRREIRERLGSDECGGEEREWLESLVEEGCLESSIFSE